MCKPKHQLISQCLSISKEVSGSIKQKVALILSDILPISASFWNAIIRREQSTVFTQGVTSLSQEASLIIGLSSLQSFAIPYEEIESWYLIQPPIDSYLSRAELLCLKDLETCSNQ